MRQITQIERRQARIRRIRRQLEQTRAAGDQEHSTTEPDSQTSTFDAEARYHIGKTQNNPENVISFVQKNQQDPAIKVSLARRSMRKEDQH